MSETSLRLNLPYIQPSQAQKHITHNEAIELLDAIVNLNLLGLDQETPPVTPNEGDSWSIGDNPTGNWVGHSNEIASFRNGGWLFATPTEGWVCWDSNTTQSYVFVGGAWQSYIPETLENLSGIGINAPNDPLNPLSVSCSSTLFSHDGSDHRLKVNKAAAGDSASILFQTAFSSRAEVGLTGDNDLTFKVSGDGVNWINAVSIPSTGDRFTLAESLNLTPSTEPAGPVSGQIYFDSSTSKLRCFDGAIWHDLF